MQKIDYGSTLHTGLQQAVDCWSLVGTNFFGDKKQAMSIYRYHPLNYTFLFSLTYWDSMWLQKEIGILDPFLFASNEVIILAFANEDFLKIFNFRVKIEKWRREILNSQ